jgi:fibronectin-binding autotransporter adhesin
MSHPVACSVVFERSARRYLGVWPRLAAALFVAWLLVPASASGQTLVTWTGGGASAAWTTGGNWSTGSVPANGTGLVFRGINRTAITGMTGSFASLAFTNTGSTSFSIAGSGTLGGTITTADASVFLLDQLNSNLTLATTSTVTTGSNHGLFLGGSISGGGGITKSGVETLTLSGSNTFLGTTTINQGVLVATSATSLPGYDTAGRFSVASGAVLSTGTGWSDAALTSLLNTGNFNSGNYLGFDSTAGARTYTGNLSGSINVAKTGLSTNTVTLSGTNTYSGTTAVMQGVLVVSSTAALPGYDTAGRFTVANGATLAVGNGVDDTAVAAILATGTSNFSPGGSFGFDTSAGDRTYSAVISGAQGLTKTGSGKLMLSAAHTYSGATNIDSGTLAFTANQSLGALVFGRVVSSTSATVGTADFSTASGTFTSLAVRTISSATNALTIGAGQTVTVNGAVSIGRGLNSVPGVIPTRFAATGDGTFINNNAGGLFLVGSGSSYSSSYNAAIANFSGLATMVVDLGSTGLVQIGDTLGGTVSSLSTDLYLAASTTITSGTILVGPQSSTNSKSRLLLGSGSTVLNVNRITSNPTVSRATTSIEFQSESGTLVLRGAVGGVSRAAVDVGVGSPDTGSAISGTITLDDHDVDLLVSTLSVGGTSNGNKTGTFSFNRGSLDATSILIATRLAGSGASTGFVTIGGGTTTVNSMTMAANTSTTAGAAANGTFTFSGGSFTSGTGGGTAINMANAVSGRTATSTINLTGGTSTMRGNVVRTGGAGTETATILLDGGSLDLGGYQIGSNTAAITLTAQRGALSNLGQLNGGGLLSKTTTGTLTLSGSSGYTGGTSIDAGLLIATARNALGTGTVAIGSSAALRLASNAIIANAITGSGTVQFAGGGIARTSSAGLATAMQLVAGEAATPVALSPNLAWSARIVDTTYSDVLDLTNTAGTIQILSLSYDPALLDDVVETDLLLGWRDGTDWVNAIDGNTGLVGGSALTGASGGYAALGILPTAAYLGSWGRDATTKTVWAVVNHNSDYAVIVVPEPGAISLAAVGVALVGWSLRKRRRIA